MKNKNSKDAKFSKTIKEIFPLKYYDEETSAFVFENDIYIDFLEVAAKDRVNISEDEIQFDIITLARFYKLTDESCKWISLNFPVTTAIQRGYKEKVLTRTNDPVRRKWLNRQIKEMEKIDQNVQKREYYLQIFGKDKISFIKQRNKVLSIIGENRGGFLKEISKEKKYSIMYKLNNMNSLIQVSESEEEYYD